MIIKLRGKFHPNDIYKKRVGSTENMTLLIFLYSFHFSNYFFTLNNNAFKRV